MAWIFVVLPLLTTWQAYQFAHPAENSQPHDHGPTAHAGEDSQGKVDKSFWEKASEDPVAYFTLWLVLFTGVLAISTIGLWVVTWLGGRSQSRDIKASIAEATRSAAAMEEVAKHIAISAQAARDSVNTVRERSAAQMRAYLSVVIGGATYQEREKSWKFETKPLIINFGHTPAHNVRFNSRSAIMPTLLPDDFNFPLTREPGEIGVVGPHQNFNMSAIVDEFVPDDEVDDIKIAKKDALHVGGIITYEDAFGDKHVTEFCQTYTWLPDGKINGYFNRRHNIAT